MRAAIIGGGISGLAAAYELARQGLNPVIYEAAPVPGGLGETFDFRGTPVEKFYHCFLPTDDHVTALATQLGIASDLVWQRTSMGIFVEQRLHQLDTPLDLLRFSPLSRTARLRTGLFTLGLRRADGSDLDNLAVRDWLVAGCGTEAFELIWRPLLESKFGEGYADVPALWLWRRLTREKDGRREVKGYLRGGLRRLTIELVRTIEAHGGQLRLSAPVRSVELEGKRVLLRSDADVEAYDLVISTIALPLLRRALPDQLLAARVAHWELPYQGVVCGVFLLSRRLTSNYWIPVVRSGVTFQGIIEMTNLVPPETFGAHVVYVMNYGPATSTLFRMSEADLSAAYLRDLCTLFPDLQSEHVLQARVFRAPYVEPIYPLGHLHNKAPLELIPGTVALATTTQVYPEITSWNSSIDLGRRAAATVLRSSGHEPTTESAGTVRDAINAW